ncbi:MAG: hypothetical protein WBE20_09115 [Candidatus Acidiferrales bacterium]
MRKFAFLLGLIFSFLPLAAHAQGFDAYGGYSYFRLDSSPNVAHLNGYDLAFTDSFFKVFGVTGELGGNYGNINGVGSNLHTVLVGPELRFPSSISPFGRVMFGGAHISGGGASSTAFATAIGGGVDIHEGRFISFRPVQLDYIYSHFGGQKQNNIRYSIGIDFRF